MARKSKGQRRSGAEVMGYYLLGENAYTKRPMTVAETVISASDRVITDPEKQKKEKNGRYSAE